MRRFKRRHFLQRCSAVTKRAESTRRIERSLRLRGSRSTCRRGTVLGAPDHGSLCLFTVLRAIGLCPSRAWRAKADRTQHGGEGPRCEQEELVARGRLRTGRWRSQAGLRGRSGVRLPMTLAFDEGKGKRLIASSLVARSRRRYRGGCGGRRFDCTRGTAVGRSMGPAYSQPPCISQVFGRASGDSRVGLSK